MIANLDFRSVVNIVFRQMWKFLLVFVPIFFIGLLFIFTTTRQYESNAKLLVKFGQDARPEVSINPSSQYGLSAEEKRGLVQSNVNILISRDIAEALLQEIGLEKAYPKIHKEKISDEQKMAYAIKSFQKDLVVNTESDAGIIKVDLFNPNPEIAQIMLKNLVALFLEKQSEVFGNPQMDVLREQAETSKQKLDEATQKLYAFKTESGIASIDEELTLLLQQRGDFAGYMSRRAINPTIEESTSDQISIDESDYNNPDQAIQKETYNLLPAQISKPGDTSRLPIVEDKQKKIDELKSKEAELLLTYKPTSQVIRNIRNNINAETQALEEAVAALNEQITDLDLQIAQKQEARLTYDALTREVALLDESFKTSQSRLQAAEVNNDLNQRKITRISVIEEPNLAIKPSKPNKFITLIMTLMVAIGFGFALAFGTELLDSTFNRPEQLANALSKPVLASFPNWAKETLNIKPLPDKSEWKEKVNGYIKNKEVPSLFYKTKATAKSINQIDVLGFFQAIESLTPNIQSKTIHLISCYAGEGSTTIANALGQFCSKSLGKNVLVIGHDNRGINSTTQLPIPNHSIVDVAQGRIALKDAIISNHEAGYNLSYAYLAQNNKYEVVLSNIDKIDAVLKELKKDFSLIIIPTPAAFSNPASLSLSKISDGVVVVVEAEKTRAPVVQQIVTNITEKGGNVIGLVLNKYSRYIPDFVYKYL